MHPWRVHPDHRVHLPDGHSCGDAQKVPQPHLLHPVLPKPLHYLALGGHCGGLPGHPALHGGVEQRADSSGPSRRQGEEGSVRIDWLKSPWWRELGHFSYSCQGNSRQAVLKKKAGDILDLVDNSALDCLTSSII